MTMSFKWNVDWCPEDEANIEVVICKCCKYPADFKDDDYICVNEKCKNTTALYFAGYTLFSNDVDEPESQFEIINLTPFEYKYVCDKFHYAAEH